jgi:hypothetical protein
LGSAVVQHAIELLHGPAACQLGQHHVQPGGHNLGK